MLKKSIKAQIIGVVSFGVLTLMIAILLMATPFKESWSYTALITALCISCFLVGVIEGNVVKKRGMIVGTLASVITLLLILTIINTAFDQSLAFENSDIFLLIPLFFGTVGGVVGANSNN